MSDRPAWLRLPRESPQAYEAFQAYLFQPAAERSIDRAYLEAGGHRGGIKRASGRWRLWSQEHRWLERAQAYDDHLAAKGFLAEEEAAARRARDRDARREQLEEREWKLANAALDKLEKMLEWPHARRRVEEDGRVTVLEPFKWNAASLARLLEAASRTGRLALDMDTDRKRVEVEAVAAEKIEAWLKRLEERLPAEDYARVLDALDA